MRIGIGLPAYIPWMNPLDIPVWAGKAEEAGFSSLGMIDRLVYQNYEPLISLAAAAAALVLLPQRRVDPRRSPNPHR